MAFLTFYNRLILLPDKTKNTFEIGSYILFYQV